MMHSSRSIATPSSGLGLALPPTSLASIRLPSGARAPSPTQTQTPLGTSELEGDNDPHPPHNRNAVQHSPTCHAARDAATAILATQPSTDGSSLSVESMSAFSVAALALPTPHHLEPYLSPILPAALYLLCTSELVHWADARTHALVVLEHVIVNLCAQPYSKSQPTSAHLLRRSNWQNVLWEALMDRVVLTAAETSGEVVLVGKCLVGLIHVRSDRGGGKVHQEEGDGEHPGEKVDERSVEWIDDWAAVVEQVLKVLESRPKMHAGLRLEFTRLLTHLLSLTSTSPTLNLTYARRCITQLALAIQWLASTRPNSALHHLGIHALTQVRTLFFDPWSTPLPPPVRRQLPRLLAALVMASAGTLDVPASVHGDAAGRGVWAEVQERIRREYVDKETWEADVTMVRQAISGMSEVRGKAVGSGVDVDVGVVQIGMEEMSM